MGKVTLIGAGSVLWSPKILGDFYAIPDQPIDEICLMDINPEALEPIAALAALMAKKTGRHLHITTETELERSVRGAGYVVVSISVGGLKAMEKDLAVAEKYGIHATVGDTVGPMGLARLLRNVAVFLDMARRIEAAAPDAWLINVSNPLTPLTRMIARETSLKTVGLCAGIINHLWILKDLLGFGDLNEVDFTVAGIDHCSWFLDLRVRGKDIYPELRGLSVGELDARASLLHSRDEWADLDSLTAGFTLFKALGNLPAISDRHLGEFFPYFLGSEENLARYNMKRTSIRHRMGWGVNARVKLTATLKGESELTLIKSRDIVVDVINALAGAAPVVTTINYPNEGQIENLPHQAIVETRGEIGTDRISPIPAGPLPSQLLSIVYPHIVRQDLVTKAGMEGSRDLFAAALVGDPTVRRLESIHDLANDLLEAHRDFLPQFFNGEAP